MRPRASVQMLALCILLSAVLSCAQGSTTEYFPIGSELGTSARVVIGRDRTIVGSAVSSKIHLDGFVIAEIRVGEYVEFFVPPGTHTVAANQASVALNFETGQSYFFIVTAALGSPYRLEVERVQAERGRRMIDDNERLGP